MKALSILATSFALFASLAPCAHAGLGSIDLGGGAVDEPYAGVAKDQYGLLIQSGFTYPEDQIRKAERIGPLCVYRDSSGVYAAHVTSSDKMECSTISSSVIVGKPASRKWSITTCRRGRKLVAKKASRCAKAKIYRIAAQRVSPHLVKDHIDRWYPYSQAYRVCGRYAGQGIAHMKISAAYEYYRPLELPCESDAVGRDFSGGSCTQVTDRAAVCGDSRDDYAVMIAETPDSWTDMGGYALYQGLCVVHPSRDLSPLIMGAISGGSLANV